MNKRFTAFVGSLVFLLSALFSLAGPSSTVQAAVDNTPDCDTVAIVRCGTMTESELRSEYDKNDYGDLPKVYNAFGISRADLNGNFVDGIVWRDGRVTVGGKVVATDAITAGRNYGGTPIPGTNGAAKFSTSKFVTEGQTAHVRMVNGKFSFAVIKSCGNPVTATPPKDQPNPEFKCVDLKMEEVTRTKRKFIAEATATGGATIEKYEFGFGDGFGITVPSDTYTYEYKRAGTFTASVVVHFKVNGEIKKVNGPQCTVPVTIKPEIKPVFACTSLMARLISSQNRTYAFDLKYTAEGGAVLRDADFTFGDGASQNGVTPSQLGSVQHSFPKSGKYTTIATLHFTVPGSTQVQDKKCEVTFDISPEACPLNPSLPKDSPDCQPCPLPGKENLPKNSPDCKEAVLPAEVIKTGPTDIALGGLGLSSLTAAGYYWRSSRNRLIAKLLGQ